MMSLLEVKEAVKQMTLEEFEELTRWMNEQRTEAEKAEADWQAWDEQLEKDVESGRLDHLIAGLEANFEAGRSKPL
jgi:hypothetical protein